MTTPNTIDLVEFPADSPEALQQNVAFFSSVFGWTYKDWGGTYSDTADSGLTSGVNAAEQGRPTMPLAVIYVTDLDETKANIIKAGGTIVQDIYAFPGGRRFHFADPAGNELAAWSA
jgi:predicted enzyme related to lactoylglutathione lyase